MQTRQRRHGFTLIELLVVIAIIAILASILFPVFSKAREKARQAGCASNIRQISLAIQMYAEDYDETYPLMSYPAGNSGNKYWYQAIYPFIQSTKIFACPDDSSTMMPGDQYTADGIWVSNKLKNSYAYNYQLKGVTMAAVTSPSDLFMNWDASTASVDTDNLPETNNRYRTVVPIHTGGDNYAFADGHVKWCSRASVPWNDDRFKLE